MMEMWQDRGIPLHVVIRAIEQVFDVFDKNPSPRTIKGLLFCREEIEAQYAEWLKMQTGKAAEDKGEKADPSFSVETISEHIHGLIAKLSQNRAEKLAEDIKRACGRLTELNENLNKNFELIDKSLTDIENFLDKSLLTKSDEVNLKEAEREIASQLRVYKSGMEPDVYKTTYHLMLLKRLRDDAGFPRLSLFYL